MLQRAILQSVRHLLLGPVLGMTPTRRSPVHPAANLEPVSPTPVYISRSIRNRR